MNKWIKCSESPPTEEGEYLVFMSGLITICRWKGIDNPDRPYEHTGWKLPYLITHYMPLPKPPEVKDE